MRTIKFIIILILYVFCVQLHAKSLKIVIIDTGVQKDYHNKPIFCRNGHKSFVSGENIYDKYGHGTNIAGLIARGAENINYCIISVKFYSPDMIDSAILTFIASLKYAYSLKPDIIHISAGGTGFNKAENEIILKILNSGIILNVAAGNESMNLDKNCNYFPACYDKRINVIGAYDVESSNYGKIVDHYLSGLDKTAFGIKMSGTSQSTAIFTGNMIKKLGKKK